VVLRVAGSNPVIHPKISPSRIKAIRDFFCPLSARVICAKSVVNIDSGRQQPSLFIVIFGINAKSDKKYV
jgi:hypothetical protein